MEMKKARFAVYLAEWFDGHFADTAISIFSKWKNRKILKLVTPEQRKLIKNASHIELWLPNVHGKFEHFDTMLVSDEEIMSDGTTYTSSMRGDRKGTCKRPASETLKNPGRWIYFEFEYPAEVHDEWIAYMDNKVENNQGYDKRLILGFLIGNVKSRDGKEICSENVQDNIIEMGKIIEKSMVIPDSLKEYFLSCFIHNCFIVPDPLQIAIMLCLAGFEPKKL